MDQKTVKEAITKRDYKLFEKRVSTVAEKEGSEAADEMLKQILDSLEEEELSWIISNMPNEIQNLVIDTGYNALVALAESGGFENNIDIWKTEEGYVKLTNDCYKFLMYNSDESGKALLSSVQIK